MGSSSRFSALVGLVLLAGYQAAAIPAATVGVDTAHCDTLSVPALTDELGTGGLFPAGEQIVAGFVNPTPPNFIAATGPAGVNCTTGTIDSPFMGNVGVTITNLNPVDFQDVWYVANAQTNISNLDGSVNGFAAFHIDKVGVNKPLISESLFNDGIFNAGETWVFLLQDFTNNAGFGANRFDAPGVPSLGIGDGSSGSIIAIVAPEPGTAGLLIVGLLGLGFRRKSA
jgi:hypothetical protein